MADEPAGTVAIAADGRTLLALPDGEVEATVATNFVGAPSDIVAVPLPINAFLLETADGPVLFDAGCGARGAPGTGRVAGHLDAAGWGTEAIVAVLMTHLHVDHAGGLLAGDAAAFPQAHLYVAEAELAFWSTPGRAEAAGQRPRSIETARAALALYADRIVPVTAGPVLAGVVAEPLPGHTPGHTGYRVGPVLIWGDIVHGTALQFANPAITHAADVDPAAARTVRSRTFAACADAGTPVAGMHLPPGGGRVVREGAAYAFRPER